MAIVYVNGRYLDRRSARIAATDPALVSGLGLFEVMRGYRRRAFRLDDHVARLRRSAREFGISAALPRRLDLVIERLFEKNGLDGGYVRLTLTGGGSLIVLARAAEPIPRSWYRRGAALTVASWRRDPGAPLVGHKTLNYLELNVERERASRRRAADALVLAPDGTVLEGTRSNVFAVSKGRLVTPPEAAGLLPGVTRKLVLELSGECGIEKVGRRLTLRRLVRSDEVFVTSTMMEVVPVRRVGDEAIAAPGPVTRRLMAAYAERVREESSGE